MFDDNNPVYPRMPLPSRIILRVWENDYGVPSVDPECIQLMILFKMHHINVEVQHAYCPYWVDIPSMEFNDVTVTKGPDLMVYAANLCKRISDTTIDTKLRSRFLAYKKYFMESFAEVFYYDCWINEANYEHAIKTWYQNVVPFPFAYLYLKKMRNKAKKRFKEVLGSRDINKFLLHQHQIAARCLEDFAGLLKDDRRFFFAEVPTTLDIIIYSYLTVALHVPLPEPSLQKLIKSHRSLVRFVKAMTERYFPGLANNFKYVEPVNVNNDCASTKSVILATLCASTAMFLYACSMGLIKPQLKYIDQT